MTNNNTEPVYEYFSWLSFLGTGVFRLFLIVVIINAGLHFNENYVATSIAIFLSTFLFVWIGQPSIQVYPDRFDFKFDSFLNLMNTQQTFYYKDIKSISLDGFYTLAFDMVEDSLLIDRYFGEPWNKINIEFKNGNLKSIRTRIYKSNLRKALKFIFQEFQRYNEQQHHPTAKDF